MCLKGILKVKSLAITSYFLMLFLKAKKEEMLWMVQSSEYRNYMQKSKKIIPFVL